MSLSRSVLAITSVMVLSPGLLYAEEQTESEPIVEEKKFYKKIGPDGKVIYTDRPDKTTEEIKLPKGTTYKPEKVPDFTPYKPKPKEKPFAYTSLEFMQPTHDQTIWDNTGTISVKIKLVPELQSGHEIVYSLNGEKSKGGQSTSYEYQDIDRGSHQLSVEVLDSKGNSLANKSVTVHLRRHAIKRN